MTRASFWALCVPVGAVLPRGGVPPGAVISASSARVKHVVGMAPPLQSCGELRAGELMVHSRCLPGCAVERLDMSVNILLL